MSPIPGTVTAHKAWAYRLMEREACGEQINIIAAQFWREALNYPADIDAKKALDVLRQKVAA